MDELVEKLSTGKHPVECSRPEKSVEALKECIDRSYVHVLFTETGTELGVQLHSKKCDFSQCNFDSGAGTAHIEGALMLNYQKVVVVADIDLETLEDVPVPFTSYQLPTTSYY